MNWIGPFTIDELLDSSTRPPEANGVYLVSKKSWYIQPTKDCIPLYVGSNTGHSKRFRTRIGDLIADMFGFFGSEAQHHSGGMTLYSYCKDNKINPKALYIGWLEGCNCVRCEENKLYDVLNPPLNKNRPSRCNRSHKIKQFGKQDEPALPPPPPPNT